MERYKMTREILKVNLDVDNIGGLGLKQQTKRVSWGQNLQKEQWVKNSTKSIENEKSTIEILKISLVVENIGGLELEQQRKGAKLAANI